MAGSVNKVILIGNVGKDPIIRSTQAGKKLASFSIATSETWKDKQTGERKEKTEWHNISVLNEGLAGVVEQYVAKGSKVYVEGQLQTRKWQDQAGQDRYTTEVVLTPFNGSLTLLSPRQDGGEARQDTGSNGQGSAAKPATANPAAASKPAQRSFDDEIPF